MISDRETTYDQDDFILEKETPSLNLPDIEAVQCFRLWNNPHYLIFRCKPNKKYDRGALLVGLLTSFHTERLMSHGKSMM